MEEWYSGPYRWLRTYKGEQPNWNGSEWSVSKLERYTKNDGQNDLQDYLLMFHIARPLIDPLFQIANIKPTDELVVEQDILGNVALNCVSLSWKSAEERGQFPEWQVPKMCFDGESHLRLLRSEKTVLHFDNLQVIQGRAVAKEITIIQTTGQADETRIRVTLLEPEEKIEEGLLKPPTDAVLRPYVIERGFPKPVSVYEVGAQISAHDVYEKFPMLQNGRPLTLLVPVFIQKDGSVKLQRDASDDSPLAPIFEKVYEAVAQWKFQPYLVDGQPVVADYYVPYKVDGKPFVPSYQSTPAPGDDVAGVHP